MLVYLTSYLCKPEHTMSELMKKAVKEAQREGIKKQLRSIQEIFFEKLVHMKQLIKLYQCF